MKTIREYPDGKLEAVGSAYRLTKGGVAVEGNAVAFEQGYDGTSVERVSVYHKATDGTITPATRVEED